MHEFAFYRGFGPNEFGQRYLCPRKIELFVWTFFWKNGKKKIKIKAKKM